MLPSSPDDDMGPPVPLSLDQNRDEQFYECPKCGWAWTAGYVVNSYERTSSYVPNVLARRSVPAFNQPTTAKRAAVAYGLCIVER